MGKKKKNKFCLFIAGLKKMIKEKPFRFVWYFFSLLLIISALSYFLPRYTWFLASPLTKVILAGFVVFLLWRPMNLVYGLIGTKGSIRTYVALLILINLIFSCVYHVAFFKDAGITYDINQPYISYGMFNGKDTTAYIVTVRDTSYSYDMAGEQIAYTVSEEKHNYQKVDPWFVLKNTFMTSLMQEPSDFFATASTYNQAVTNNKKNGIFEKDIVGYEINCKPVCCCKKCSCRKTFNKPIIEEGRDKEKSELFHWLLILQVFISWIFFGVFISILYNKFRYES